MRKTLAAFVVLILAGASKGDVVVYNQSGSPTVQQGLTSAGYKIGQSFTNTAWDGATVGSVSFYFSNDGGSGTYSGNAVVNIYAANVSGGSGNYVPTGSALATSSNVSFADVGVGSAIKTFNFSSGAGLALNGIYIAEVNFSGVTGIGPSNTVYSAGVSPILDGLNAYTNTFTTTVQTFQMRGSVVMVPEPGTLLLGSVAVCGGAGAWWRRKRKVGEGVQEEAVI